jgi:hypothetical protein
MKFLGGLIFIIGGYRFNGMAEMNAWQADEASTEK